MIVDEPVRRREGAQNVPTPVTLERETPAPENVSYGRTGVQEQQPVHQITVGVGEVIRDAARHWLLLLRRVEHHPVSVVRPKDPPEGVDDVGPTPLVRRRAGRLGGGGSHVRQPERGPVQVWQIGVQPAEQLERAEGCCLLHQAAETPRSPSESGRGVQLLHQSSLAGLRTLPPALCSAGAGGTQ